MNNNKFNKVKTLVQVLARSAQLHMDEVNTSFKGSKLLFHATMSTKMNSLADPDGQALSAMPFLISFF